MTMPNLHPQFVHFPIAGGIFLLILTLLHLFFKKEGARAAASWVLPFTTLGAVAAAGTGLLFEEFFPHPHEGEAHGLMELHKTLGLITAGLFVLLTLLVWFLKKRASPILPSIFLFGALGGAVLVTLTGYLGGELGHTHALAVPEGKKTSETLPSSGRKEPGETKDPQGHSHDHDHDHDPHH